MKRQVNVTLDDDLFRRFRIRAIEQGTSASAILEKLMAGYLGESTYPPRSGGHAEGKRAHAKAAKTATRKTRKAV
jgi:hypothetical protein